MARQAGEKAHVWWVVGRSQPLAAAMVLDTPGRAGMLFYSSPAAPGVSRAAAVQVIGEISRDAICRGAAFVQATVYPSNRKLIRTLTDAGLTHLADLADMRLDFDLSTPARPAEPSPWVWRGYNQFTHEQLGEVILATYGESLDCPRLKGLRSGTQIVAGHRNTGVFSSATWWIIDAPDGTPAGCLLLNDVAGQRTTNIVYLGAVPAFRRQGLARAMLAHAQSIARAAGQLALTLAVDTRNTPAHQAYLQAGFIHVSKRVVYALCAKREEA